EEYRSEGLHGHPRCKFEEMDTRRHHRCGRSHVAIADRPVDPSRIPRMATDTPPLALPDRLLGGRGHSDRHPASIVSPRAERSSGADAYPDSVDVGASPGARRARGVASPGAGRDTSIWLSRRHTPSMLATIAWANCLR